MRVLIATDGSNDAKTAIATANQLLRREDLKVDVLSVEPDLVSVGATDTIRRGQANQIMRKSRLVAEAADEIHRTEGLRTDALLELGSPADKILKLAPDYDLVVVGAHGQDERHQPGLGPVSSDVVRNAHTSVLVGRDLSSAGNYRVLVALDGSDAGYEALKALNMYFDVRSLDITLMHVVELPWTLEREYEEEAQDLCLSSFHARFIAELRRGADAIIDRGLQQLETWDMAATTIIEEGDPSLEIASHIEEGNYDLVVVGATGSSDMKHMLLGSVSHNLAWNAPCSVLVVRS